MQGAFGKSDNMMYLDDVLKKPENASKRRYVSSTLSEFNHTMKSIHGTSMGEKTKQFLYEAAYEKTKNRVVSRPGYNKDCLADQLSLSVLWTYYIKYRDYEI